VRGHLYGLREPSKNLSSMTSPDQQAVGRALRELRKRAGLTQEQVAARMGTSSTYLSRLEAGQRDIRFSTILRLLDAVGADLHQLADAIDRHDSRP
jgi:HTH-type transcriptional regulator/antitoxin HipB